MPEKELELLEKNLQGEALHIELGKRYHRQRQYNLALGELKKAMAINPHNALTHFEMGNVLVKIKDDFQAEREYKKSLTLNPDFFDASLELGKIYRRQGRVNLALDEFKKVLKSAPSNWDAHYELGRIYKEWGDYTHATEEMKKAAKIKPDNEQIHFELGKIYRDMGLSDPAILEFKKVLSIGNNDNDPFIKNKVLNEIEITEKRLVLQSKVRAILAMVINRCNVRCIMCKIWKSSWQASAKTLKELVQLFPYIEDMVWEGGEVFLMKEFSQILEETGQYPHMKQVIFTNGLLLNEKIIEKLIHIRGNVDIVFSIDAVTKDTYEYIRQGGKFERLIKNLTLFNEIKKRQHCNINIYFNAVIMRSNYHQIERFIDFAKEYGFNAMTLTPIRGDYGAENIFENHDIEALEYIKKVMPRITSKAYEYGIRLHNWIPGTQGEGCHPQIQSEAYTNLSANTTTSLNNDYKKIICYAPWQRLVIDSEGQVRPFVFCLNKWIGNTGRSSLQDIWNCEAMQEYRKRLINHDYRDLCQPECISGQVAEKIRDVV